MCLSVQAPGTIPIPPSLREEHPGVSLVSSLAQPRAKASRALLEGQMAKRTPLPPAQGTFQEQPQGWEHWQVSNRGTMTSQPPDAKPFPWDEGRQKSPRSCPGMLSSSPSACQVSRGAAHHHRGMPWPGNQHPWAQSPGGPGRPSTEIPSVAQIHFPLSPGCAWESSKRPGYKGGSSLRISVTLPCDKHSCHCSGCWRCCPGSAPSTQPGRKQGHHAGGAAPQAGQ